MALHRSSSLLSFLVLVKLTCIARAEELPEFVLCADRLCKEKIGEGVTRQQFPAADSFKLSFAQNESVTIYSRSDGGSQDLLGVEISGRKGFVPARLILESRSFRKRETLVRVKADEVYAIGNDSIPKQDQLPQATAPPPVPPSLVSGSSVLSTNAAEVQSSLSTSTSIGTGVQTDAPTPPGAIAGDVIQSCTLDGTVMYGEGCESEDTEVLPADTGSSSFHQQYMQTPTAQFLNTVTPSSVHVKELHKSEEKGSAEVEVFAENNIRSLASETREDAAGSPEGSKEVPSSQGDEAASAYVGGQVPPESNTPGDSKEEDRSIGDKGAEIPVTDEEEKDPFTDEGSRVPAGQEENQDPHIPEEQDRLKLGNESEGHFTPSKQRDEDLSKETAAGSGYLNDNDEENIAGEDDNEEEEEEGDDDVAAADVEAEGKGGDILESSVENSIEDPASASRAGGLNASKMAGDYTEGTDDVLVAKKEQHVTGMAKDTVPHIPAVNEDALNVGASPSVEHMQQLEDKSDAKMPSSVGASDSDSFLSTSSGAAGMGTQLSGSGTSAPAVVESTVQSSVPVSGHEQVGGPADSSSPTQLLSTTEAASPELPLDSGSGVVMPSVTTESSTTAEDAVDDSSQSLDAVSSLSPHSSLASTAEHDTTTHDIHQSAARVLSGGPEDEQSGGPEDRTSPLLLPSTTEATGQEYDLATPSLDSSVSGSVHALGAAPPGTTAEPCATADGSVTVEGGSPASTAEHQTAVHDHQSTVEDSKDDATTTRPSYERRSLFSVSLHQEEATGAPVLPSLVPSSSESSRRSTPSGNPWLLRDRPLEAAQVSENVDTAVPTSIVADADTPSVTYGVHESSHIALSHDDIEMQHETSDNVPEEDFMDYVQLYFDMIKGYTQSMVDMLPDPLHAALLDLGVHGPSPRVAVFTFLSGVFGFVLLISYGCFVNSRKEASLMASVASLEQKLFTVLTERDVLREEFEQAKAQAANTYKNSLEKQDLVRKLQKENKDLERGNQQLEAALHKVKEAWTQDRDQLGSLRSELSRKEAEITELRGTMEKEMEEKGRMHAELQKCEGVLTEERTKIEQFKSNEKQLNSELAELQASKETLLEEREVWNERITELSSKVESDAYEINKLLMSLHDRDAENQVLQDTIKQMSILQEMCGRTEDDTADASHSKELEACLNRLMDVGQMRLEYQKVKEQNDLLEEQLSAERRHLEKKRDDLEKLEDEIERLKRDTREAQRERTEAVTKLEILSTYFKDREVQLQKEIGLQEALRCQKDVDASTAMQQLALLEQQNSSYKSQLSSLKQEMEISERNYKNQITDQEKRAHENWLAARAAERKLEEANKELASLRQRLTFVQHEKDQQMHSTFSNNHSAKQSLASSDDLTVEAPPLPPLHPLYLPPPPFMGETFHPRPPEPWMLPGSLPPPDLMFKRHRGSPGPLARASPGSSLRDESPPPPHSRDSRGSPLSRLPHFYDPRGGPSPPLGPLGPPHLLGPLGPPPLGPMGPPLGPHPGPMGPSSRGPRGHHRSSNSTSDGRSSAHSTTRPSPQPSQNVRSNNGPATGV